MRFEFSTAHRILFGPGTLSETFAQASALGQRAFVVVDSPERAAPLLDGLRQAGLETTVWVVRGEPEVESVMVATRKAQEAKSDLIIGFGGGSSLDTAKAVSALLTNPGDIYEYLEVIGEGRPLRVPAAPCIAIPTTAGTGAEVTRNAVLTATRQRVKVSLRSPFLLPRLAIVDPQLTLSLPPAITASSGLDALTQLIEPFVSNAANPLTDALCSEGIRRVARSLQQAYHHGDDLSAREDMSLASLFGGLALANARLGAVHGLAGPIGGMFHAPHGAICGRLLPFVIETNLQALRQREPQSPALERYTQIARWLTARSNAGADEGVLWLRECLEEFSIPPLRVYGVSHRDFPILAAQAGRASSMKGNPIALTEMELVAILAAATD